MQHTHSVQYKEGANIFRWSRDGRLGASAGLADNCILIWDMETKETIDKVKHTAGFMSLDWCPASNNLAMVTLILSISVPAQTASSSKICEDGQWNHWANVNPFLNEKPKQEAKEKKKKKHKKHEEEEDEEETKPQEITKDELLKSMFLDDEAEEDDKDEDVESDGGNDYLDDIFAADEKEALAKTKTESGSGLHRLKHKTDDTEGKSIKTERGKTQNTNAAVLNTMPSLSPLSVVKAADENAMLDEELDDDIIEYVPNEDENENNEAENPPVEIVQSKSKSKSNSNAPPSGAYVRGRMPQASFQPNASPVTDSKRFFGTHPLICLFNSLTLACSMDAVWQHLQLFGQLD